MPIGPALKQLDEALAADEVHVWHTSLELPQPWVDRLHAQLAANEQARAARFLVADARQQYIISHAFLRAVLAKYLHVEPVAVRFRVGENDKPDVEDSDICFNLSHTSGTAALAITRTGRIGMDVERVRDNLNPQELARRFFSLQECEWLEQQPDRLNAFFSCWTAKESYIKACGGGLSMGLDGFAVIPKSGNARLQLEICGGPEESKKWSIWQLELKAGLCSAVAVEAPDVTVRIGEWIPGNET